MALSTKPWTTFASSITTTVDEQNEVLDFLESVLNAGGLGTGAQYDDFGRFTQFDPSVLTPFLSEQAGNQYNYFKNQVKPNTENLIKDVADDVFLRETNQDTDTENNLDAWDSFFNSFASDINQGIIEFIKELRKDAFGTSVIQLKDLSSLNTGSNIDIGTKIGQLNDSHLLKINLAEQFLNKARNFYQNILSDFEFGVGIEYDNGVRIPGESIDVVLTSLKVNGVDKSANLPIGNFETNENGFFKLRYQIVQEDDEHYPTEVKLTFSHDTLTVSPSNIDVPTKLSGAAGSQDGPKEFRTFSLGAEPSGSATSEDLDTVVTRLTALNKSAITTFVNSINESNNGITDIVENIQYTSTNLELIRRIGGFQNTVEFETADPSLQENLKTIDRHAFLEGIGVDNRISDTLDPGDQGMSLPDVMHETRSTMVKKLKDVQGQNTFSVYAENDGITAAMNYTTSFVAQVMANQRMKVHNPPNDSGKSLSTDTATYVRIKTLLDRIYKEKCACNDCEAAVSPLAYLLDLIHYTVSFVKEDDGVGQRKKLSLGDLGDRFHQLFKELPAACDSVNESVSQARLSAEVLHNRKGDPDNTNIDAYLEEVYEGMLRLLGTNKTQILDAIGNEDRKRRLCERLGFKYDLNFDIIEKLNLDLDPGTPSENKISQDNLERLSGLKSAHGSPFSLGYKTGDVDNKVTYWRFKNYQYGLNTYADGKIRIKLTEVVDTITAEIFGSGTNPVGSGSITDSGGTGNIAIIPQGINGISGTIQINSYTGNLDNIFVQVIPEILVAQLSSFQERWLELDNNKKHIIDPDQLVPQDFKDPFDNSADKPIKIWKDRKTLVEGLKSSISEGSPGYANGDFQFRSLRADGVILNETAPTLHRAISMTKDNEGNVYIMDKENIYRLDDDLLNLSTWNGTSLTEADFTKLNRIEYSSAMDLICVSDDGTNKSYQFFGKDGSLKIKLILEGTAEGQIGTPFAATILQSKPDGSGGEMIILDKGDVTGQGSDLNRVQKLQRPELLAGSQELGSTAQQAVVLGMDSFDSHSIIAWCSKDPDSITSQSTVRILQADNDAPLEFYQLPNGSTAGFSNPVDVSFHHSGMLFVLDSDAKRVAFFSPELEALGSFDLPDPDRIPSAIAVSKHTSQDIFYVSYEGLSTIDQYLFDITKTVTILTSNVDHMDTQDASMFGKMVCNDAGDLFITSQDKVKRFANGSSGTTYTNFHDSTLSNLEYINIREDAGSFSGLVVSSKAGVVELTDASGVPATSYDGTILAKDNSWLNLKNIGGVAPQIDGELVCSGFGARVYKVSKPKLLFYPPSGNLKEIFVSSLSDQKLYAGTTENAFQIDPDDGEILVDFKALNNQIPTTFDVRSISEDEYQNILIFSLDGTDNSSLYRFDRENIFVERFSLNTVSEGLWTALPYGHNYLPLPGRRGLVSIYKSESDPINRIVKVDLKTQLEELLSGYAVQVVAPDKLEVSPLNYEDLLDIQKMEQSGESIQAKLGRHFLSFSEYRYLQNIIQRELASIGFPSSVDWWDQTKDILMNVFKKAKSFDWSIEENQAGIHVGPLHFSLLDAVSESQLEFNRWRSDLTARIDFRNTLDSRITQQANLFQANRGLIEDLEKDHMTTLRDIYIEADAKNSLELENELLIDMHSTGEVRTNRITQAMTTLQGLLWGSYNSVYESGTNMNVDSDRFEEEWQWLGTYADWRAAMMVFLYPENLLAPQYKKLFSPKFREMTINVINSRRFSEKSSVELAEEFQRYLKEIKEIDPRSGVLCNVSWKESGAGYRGEKKTDLRVIVAGEGNDGRYFYSLQHPIKTSLDELSVWKPFPEEVNDLTLIGTVTVSEPKEKILYVFQERGDKNALQGLYLDPDGLEWSDKLIKIGNPNMGAELREGENITLSRYGLANSNDNKFRSLFRFYQTRQKKDATHYNYRGYCYVLSHNDNGPFWVSLRKEQNLNPSDYYVPLNYLILKDGFSESIFISDFKGWWYENINYGSSLLFKSSNPSIPDKSISFNYKRTLGFATLSPTEILIPFSHHINSGGEKRTILKPLLVEFGANQINVEQPLEGNTMPQFLWWYNGIANTSGVSFYDHNMVIFHHGITKIARLSETSGVISYPQLKIITPDVPLKSQSVLGLEKEPVRKPDLDDPHFKNRDAYSRFYTDEAFLHFPLLMAEKLKEQGKFEESLQWYRQVYDHNVENGRPIYKGLKFENAQSNYKKTENWLEDPLDPHKMAKRRNDAYKKYVVNGITRCLIAYADSEYTRDTAESVAKARELYKEALETLGILMEVNPDSNCAVILSGLSITVDASLSSWQGLVDQGIATLGYVKDRDKLQTFVDGPFALTHKPNIENETNESGLQTDIQAFLDDVLELAFDQPGIQQFDFGNLYLNSNKNLEKLLLATMTAVDGEEGGTDVHRKAHSNARTALENNVGVSDTVTDGTDSATADWLEDESLARVDTPNYQGSILDLADGVLIEEEFYDANVLAPDDSGENQNNQRTIDNTNQQNTQTSNNAGAGFQPVAGFVFCVPRNPLSDYLALKAQLNLQKIYAGQNISGFERQLEPFSAPIDATSGLPGLSENGGTDINDLGVLPVIHRFSGLIARAKEQATYASQMENSFLNLLEKYDAESFSILQAKQNLNLSNENIRLQDIRVKEARQGQQLAGLQLEKSQITKDHFAQLLDEGLLSFEVESIGFMKSSQRLTLSAGNFSAMANILGGYSSFIQISGGVIPNPGAILAGYAGAAAAVTSSRAQAASMQSSIMSQLASYERRAQEWEFQELLANQDIKIGQQNVKISETRVQISAQEKRISELQKQHAQESLDFLKNKFTSVELYAWMAGVMEGVYSYFLAQATATAKMAYYQLGFERQQTPATTIREDYWNEGSDGSGLTSGLQVEGDSDRKGLTGSARLIQDIIQLEQEALETDQRKLQISKTISLSSLDPGAFQEFKDTGVLTFATPMEIFDRDFPGHYLRLVKKVSVTVVALVPTVEGIKASLSNVGTSKVVKGTINPTKVDINRLPEKISFSNAIGATGVFELQQDNSKLNPFEGMGVESQWAFEMQKPSNLMDFDSIADILLTVDYTALDNPTYKSVVIGELGTQFEGERPFSFKSSFPDQWFDLNNCELLESEDKFKVRLDLSNRDFPPNLENIQLQNVLMAFDIEDQENNPLTIEVSLNGDSCSTTEGRISTRNSTGANWLSHMVPLSGDLIWDLEIVSIKDFSGVSMGESQMSKVINERISDVYMSLSFKAQTPAWTV